MLWFCGGIGCVGSGLWENGNKFVVFTAGGLKVVGILFVVKGWFAIIWLLFKLRIFYVGGGIKLLLS